MEPGPAAPGARHVPAARYAPRATVPAGAERLDGRTEAVAEWFPARGGPEVVVAAGAGRLPNDLQLAGAGLELEQGLAGQIALEHRPVTVVAACVEILQREREPAEILRAR